jgi:6-phosphogluconolactonase (cycloisomerase 2 family)
VIGGVIQGTSQLTVTSSGADCNAGTIAMTSPGSVNFSAHTVVTNTSSTGSCSTVSGSVFNAGTINLNTGSFRLGGGATLNNLPGATINLQGTTGILDGGGAGNVLNNQGSLLEAGSANTIGFTGSFNNSGTVTTSGSLTFGLSTNFIQTAGSTTVNGGILASDALLEIDGGLIGGTGSINAKLNNAGGIFGAGSQNTPGTLNLNQPETQGSNSTLYALISEVLAPVPYDQINSSSSMTVAGTLRFQFGPGFTPAPNNTFNIANFASASGNFARVITPNSTCKAVLTPTSKALSVKFTSTNVSVTINPPSVTLPENQQQQFTDTVSNGCGNGVTWSVHEPGGGTVTQAGLYTAPATTGTFHVVVVSVADPTKFAFSTVTVTAPRNQLAVVPHAAVLQPGKTVSLHASQTVVWSVVEGKSGGNVSANGRYTAPLKPGLYHVMASSTADPSLRALANIAVGGKLKSAYVANVDQSSISQLTAGSATNSLREAASLATGQHPASLALSPDGKFLLSANQDSNDVSVFALSPASGTLRTVAGASAAAGTLPSALAFDPSGHFALVTNRGSDDISTFSVSASGVLTFLGSHALAAGEAPGAIAIHPSGSMAFIASTGSSLIHVFAFTAGSLQEISRSPFDVDKAPAALLIDASERFLFVANRDSGNVSAFSIDVKNETLRPVAGSPFKVGKSPAAIAIDLTGSYLFVADHDSNDIATFQVDGKTGALTPLGRTLLPTVGPSSLAIDPSGQSLYVTSDQSASMTTLKLDVTAGRLTLSDKTPGRGRASSIVVAGSEMEVR